MRWLLLVTASFMLMACGRTPLDHSLDDAYLAYEQNNCAQAMLELSRAERLSRTKRYMQPEISLLRGQCLEREGYFYDAAQTYRYITTHYPSTEYAYRAEARLTVLQQLGLGQKSAVAKPLLSRP